MRRFFSILLAFVMALALTGLALGITSQFIDQTDECTVTSTVEIQVRERSKAYRANTLECGTLTFSAIPLRGLTTPEARQMWGNLQLGEKYKITYVREGFGVFSRNSAAVKVETIK